MREHRLIERMVALLDREQAAVKAGRTNSATLYEAVDFFRTYADRTHHGKEEDILFRDLARKTLSAEHARIMSELVQEHVRARGMVTQLSEAAGRLDAGDSSAREDITRMLSGLVIFYPAHIQKEDKHFFYPCLEYFDGQEQARMLDEFWEFDRMLIHEKYTKVVDRLESGVRRG